MDARGWVWISLGVFLMTAVGGGAVVAYNKSMRRGLRNNNPGNLRMTDIAWKGKVPRAENKDGAFEQFRDYQGVPGYVWGLRAMFMDVRGDITKDGKNTLRKLIEEYAPAIENKTDSYILAVGKEVGLQPDAPIQPAHYLPLLKAMVRVENGEQPYPDAVIRQAMNLA